MTWSLCNPAKHYYDFVSIVIKVGSCSSYCNHGNLYSVSVFVGTDQGVTLYRCSVATGSESRPQQPPWTGTSNITVKHMQERAWSLKGWTASGPDMTNTYWLKRLAIRHECLAALMNQPLMDGTQSECFIDGQPVLILEDPQKGVSIQLQTDNLPLHNMNGPKIGTPGVSKHELLQDRVVTWDHKTRQTNPCSAWNEYKKACDWIPHMWILGCMAIFSYHRTPRTFIENLVRVWKMTLEAKFKPIAQVTIKREYTKEILYPSSIIGLNLLCQITTKNCYYQLITLLLDRRQVSAEESGVETAGQRHRTKQMQWVEQRWVSSWFSQFNSI